MWSAAGLHSWITAFLGYVDDLPSSSKILKAITFEDDTSLFHEHKNIILIPSLVDFHSLYELLHSQVYRNGLKLRITNVEICIDK